MSHLIYLLTIPYVVQDSVGIVYKSIFMSVYVASQIK